MEQVDLLIVGAGWHGLAMGKTYVEAFPDRKIVIADSAATVGGVWARERLYPGLATNNVSGTYEFSDFPMDLERYSLEPWQHIPGHTVHQYLFDFAKHFGLVQRMRLQTTIDCCVLGQGGIWTIEYTDASDRAVDGAATQRSGTVLARNLVIATGVASKPSVPKFPGHETFQGHLFHAKELRSHAHLLDAAKQHIVVIGGNKSAWDACYLAAQRAAPDATVHMLLRPSGRGPSWLWRRGPQIGSLNLTYITSTRIFTMFDPSPMHSAWKRFFQRSVVGRFVCNLFWRTLDRRVLAAAGHSSTQLGKMSKEQNTGKDVALRSLRPWYSAYWMGNSLSVDNYPTDWYEHLVSGRIVVHHCEIEALLPDTRSVRLSDGQVLDDVDIIVAATGWDIGPNIRFDPPILARDLEITGVRGARMTQEERGRENDQLVSEALKAIHTEFAGLLNSPKTHRTEARASCRLYRFMIPLHPQSLQLSNLAFAGFSQSIQTALVAQVQALWITAFLEKKLVKPPKDLQSCQKWAYLHTEYQRLRHLGTPYPDLMIDSIPYIDLLMRDVGLNTGRKGNWWRDFVEPNTSKDYRGLVAEWIRERGTS